MEKRKPQDEVLFKPTPLRASLENLPATPSTHGALLVTRSETATNCRLPPIMRPDRGYRRTRESNERHEKLNRRLRRSGEFFDDRGTMSVLDKDCSNRREKMGRGLTRSDAETVPIGQKTQHVPHPPKSSDAKRKQAKKTILQGERSLSCPPSKNVIIEEIYLLPRSKSTDSMIQNSQREGIGIHLPLRGTRSDETRGLRGIRCCGEILSRRVYYSDRSENDLSCLFGGEGIDARGAMANEVREPYYSNSPPFPNRENKSGAQTEMKVNLEAEAEWEQLGATEKQHSPSQLRQGNMTESLSWAEASNQDRFSDSHRLFPGTVHGNAVKDLDDEKKHSTCCVTHRTEQRQAQRVRRYGVCKVRPEARGKKMEYSVGHSTDKSEESQTHQEVCEAPDEATNKEKGSLVRPTSDESGEKETRRQRDATQMRCQRGRGDENEEANKKQEPSASPATDETADERQGQHMRRQGVCEAVDNTAAGRRRARVLKKKLFGDDLPIHDGLTTEDVLRRGLNKRL